MRRSFYLEFPYMEREEYVDFLKEVNNIIGKEDLVYLAISNIPNHVESAFIIEIINENKADKVKKLIEQYKLNIRDDRGLREIILEIRDRNWNLKNIPMRCDEFLIEQLFFDSFIFIDLVNSN